MSFIIDGILVAVCIIIIVVSVKRGFVKTVLSFVASVASLLAALAFSPALADIINTKFVLPSISGNIAGTLTSIAGETAEGIGELFEKMPQTLTDILERYSINGDYLESIVDKVSTGEAGTSAVSDMIASPVADAISYAAAFIIIFVASLIVLKLVVLIIDAVFRLPGLKTVNRAAGFIVGLLIAAVFVFAYSFFASRITVALGSLSPSLFGQETLDSTIIVKFFAEHNIVSVLNSINGR